VSVLCQKRTLRDWAHALSNPLLARRRATVDLTDQLLEHVDDHCLLRVESGPLGVFGAPTFFIDGQMHWGQDRLDFVKDALK